MIGVSRSSLKHDLDVYQALGQRRHKRRVYVLCWGIVFKSILLDVSMTSK